MDPRRAQRVSEAIREELAEIIEYEMSDPRLKAVTISDVLISPDGRVAHVRVLCAAAESGEGQVLEALEGARHYLRRQLAGRLRLFRVPDLHFQRDPGGGAEDRIEQLLKRVRKNREKSPGPAENES